MCRAAISDRTSTFDILDVVTGKSGNSHFPAPLYLLDLSTAVDLRIFTEYGVHIIIVSSYGSRTVHVAVLWVEPPYR